MLKRRMLHKNEDRDLRAHMQTKEYQDAWKSPETGECV